jgi:hypothetical protein
METNIREIHIEKGRIWHKKLGWTWRHLGNIHKLRVIAPTSPWETESMDDFTDLVELELLDLTGNSTIQVLPSLSGATALSTLVLDGCTGLEHVGPESLHLLKHLASIQVVERKIKCPVSPWLPVQGWSTFDWVDISRTLRSWTSQTHQSKHLISEVWWCRSHPYVRSF